MIFICMQALMLERHVLHFLFQRQRGDVAPYGLSH